MAILNNNPLIGSGGNQGYNINNSLRLRSSASAYLNRTPGTAGNRKTWTLSAWVKRGALSSSASFGILEGNSSATELTAFRFGNDNLSIQDYSTSGGYNLLWNTTAVYRDPSAWYHIVISYDATQASSANTVKMFVNGTQQTVTFLAAQGSYAQNRDSYINATNAQRIGVYNGLSNYFDGYLAEVNLIDGSAKVASDFGETDTTTGVWKPKAYSGTYGTNGFYLKFSDIATTSGSNAGLGKDFSGNSNYWTTNNISVTSGTTYDAMTDSPTNTSATVANYAVMSPIMAGSITFTDGNLSVQKVGASYGNTNSTIAFPTSGKYYFEATIVSGTNGNNQQMGMGTQGGGYYFVLDCYYSSNLIRKVADGVATTGYGTASVGTVIGVAVDADNGKAYLAINNTWIDSSSPTGGTGGYSMTAGQVYSGFFQAYNSGVSAYNFGQRPFTYTPPTGYKALNTYNLPTPTILQGNKYMDATTWTGDNTSPRSITNAGSFKPDFVWVKGRNGTINHILVDSVRGTSKNLISNSTSAEVTTPVNGSVSAFNSTGFSVASGTSDSVEVNYSVGGTTYTYVGWQWQAGQGSTSSNTSGSITSTVSVNASAGFSIVTYTGTGANATVGHGLGVAPAMIIFKQRNAVRGWPVYHRSLGASTTIYLNVTNASNADSTIFNATSPTSSVFSLGASSDTNNGNVVAYCWAEIAGFSRFGSYTGNGSADGPFIYLGFRPKFFMWKRTDTTINPGWTIIDSTRNPYNYADLELNPNSSAAEGAGGASFNEDLLSNGLKFRNTGNGANASGGTYIYAAFAENPFKNALAR